MNSARYAIDDGAAGVASILSTLASLKDFYGSNPAIRRAALAIAGSAKDNDELGFANRLAAFVRQAVVYVADPIDAEFIQTPDVMLLEINQRGRTAGDCDDHCLLFAALAQSVGIRCEIAGAILGESPIVNHVVVLAYLGGGPLTFDLCAKGFNQPIHAELFFAE